MVDEARVHALLVDDRVSTTRRIEALTRDFAGILDAACDVATDDEHDPEGATIAFERAQVTALRDHARAHLADVLHALRRLGDGTYDTCECCHRPIARVRLEARPVARTCISCAAGQR